MFSFVTQEKKSNIPIFVFEIESIRHFVANLLRLLTSSVISAEEPTSDNGMTDYFFFLNSRFFQKWLMNAKLNSLSVS